MGADRPRSCPSPAPEAPALLVPHEILTATFYVLRGGIAWRLLPSDLPPKSTVYRWLSLRGAMACSQTINHLLVMADRERVGQEALPTAAMLDTDKRGLILVLQPGDSQDRDEACMALRLSRRVPVHRHSLC
jgi:transposase